MKRTFLVEGGELVLPDAHFPIETFARDQRGQLWVKDGFDRPWQKTKMVLPLNATVHDATFRAIG